jgi:hypothetical protein
LDSSTLQTCVILTLAGHFLPNAIEFGPLLPGREKSALQRRSARHVGSRMEKESTPLWVWLSVVLLAIGTVTYVVTVYFVEHVLAWF